MENVKQIETLLLDGDIESNFIRKWKERFEIYMDAMRVAQWCKTHIGKRSIGGVRKFESASY